MLLKDLAVQLGVKYKGDGDCEIITVATLQNATPGAISFLANLKYKDHIKGCKASALIVNCELSKTLDMACLISDNPYLIYAKVTQILYPKSRLTPNISQNAIVAQSAVIGKECSISANVFIDSHCVIGDRVTIEAGVVLSRGSIIGSGTIIYPNVTIYEGCQVGSNCIIQSGTVIGADGFGFANDQGKWVKIEQIGRVIVGDDVEIGANTTIDRGAIEDTTISDGVKLDNQIQVAHNVCIGKNTAIAGGTAIAGSSKIGENCTIAGMVGIAGHLVICNGVHITAKSLVTKSIAEPGVYSSSFAADKDRKWKKKLARLNLLDTLFKRVKKLERQLSFKE